VDLGWRAYRIRPALPWRDPGRWSWAVTRTVREPVVSKLVARLAIEPECLIGAHAATADGRHGAPDRWSLEAGFFGHRLGERLGEESCRRPSIGSLSTALAGEGRRQRALTRSGSMIIALTGNLPQLTHHRRTRRASRREHPVHPAACRRASSTVLEGRKFVRFDPAEVSGWLDRSRVASAGWAATEWAGTCPELSRPRGRLVEWRPVRSPSGDQ
jgi:hypothetical protein